MLEAEFWQIVKTNHPLADPETIAAELKTKLIQLNDSELASFDKFFNLKMRESYTWDLWGAAYVIAGCNSEYGFAEFRSWLISRGEEIFTETLKNPDNLANYPVIPKQDDLAYPFLDEYDLIAGLIFEERTGNELPFVPSGQEAPKGKQFKDKTKYLRQTYPNLFALYWIGLN